MSRLAFNENEQSMLSEADRLDAQAKGLRDRAFDSRNGRDKERPLKERLIFAARSRCLCGHGIAYDPTGEVASDKDSSPFVLPSQWECSAILLGTADSTLKHSGPFRFACYEIKSENQPSAGGATTRDPIEPHPDALPKNAA